MPASSSASAYSSTPMSYDRFRPKFPLDPFAASDNPRTSPTPSREPWTLDLDALPLSSILQHERRVVLVIGQATSGALDPLFASTHLASSLLIIASHRPPALPFETQPSVYTLRLRGPLAVADAGATRLVEILEWALQVARLWRRSGGPKKQELMEEVTPAAESVPLGQGFGRIRYSAAPDSQHAVQGFSPSESVTSLAPSSGTRSRRLSFFKRKSYAALIPDPASAKPFDSLIHFLPVDAPDKARLKAAILVTTLTRPYLAAPPIRGATTRFYSESTVKLSSKGGKRWSFLRGSAFLASPGSSSILNVPGQSRSTSDLSEKTVTGRSSLATLALLRARRSRLIHVVSSAPGTIRAAASASRHPATNTAQAHLIRSMEAFLLSFSFSVSPDFPTPIAGFASSDADIAKARPYVLPASALKEVLRVPSDDEDDEGEENSEESRKNRTTTWTLVDLVLSGALEGESESIRSTPELRPGPRQWQESDESRRGKEKLPGSPNESEWMMHRAWIGGVREIGIVRSSALKPAEKAHIAPSRSSSQPLLPSQTHALTNSTPPPALRPQPALHSQSPISYPMPARLQITQPSDGESASRGVNTNGRRTVSSKSRSPLNIDTRRRDRKTSGYQTLAIEKRLPTPPEDENENEDQNADEGDSMISNATSGTRSFVLDDTDENSTTLAKNEFECAYAERLSPPLKQRSEPLASPDAFGRDPSLPCEAYTRTAEWQKLQSPTQTPSPASTTVSSRSSASTPVPSSIRNQKSERHRYLPTRPSSRRYEAYKAEHDDTKRYPGEASLPTPPDSEEALVEDDAPTPVATSVPSHASSRGRENTLTDVVPTSRDRRTSQEGRRDSSGRAGVTPTLASHREEREQETERERRKRSHSQPTRPSTTPVKDRIREKAIFERRTSGRARTSSEKPSRPVMTRSKSSGERRRKLEERSSKPDMRQPPAEKERERGQHVARRVPVPRLEGVLPPLPRPPPPQRAPPPPPDPSPSLSKKTFPFSAVHPSKSAPDLSSVSVPERSPSSTASKHNGKWKFWRDRHCAVFESVTAARS